MARTSAALVLAAVVLMAACTAAEAQTTVNQQVRQLFCWQLTQGIGAAAGAKNVRIALYNSWNNINKGSVSGYWLGQQNDGLLFATKDNTWCDLGGLTDWANVDSYKSYKVWEKDQRTYKAIDVAQKLRLVSYV